MEDFDLRKYLAEGKLNENEDDSYYMDEIKRDLEELDDKEANKYLEDLAKAIAASEKLELTDRHWDVINHLRDEFFNNGFSWLEGFIKSNTFKVSSLPSFPAGWFTAKSFLDIPLLSIQTTANASPIAIATVVLAVGARYKGQTSLSTPASKEKSLCIANVELRFPKMPI